MGTAEPLRALLRATFHMTDTSLKTGDAFPDAHKAGREAIQAHDAANLGQQLHALADSLQTGLAAGQVAPSAAYLVTRAVDALRDLADDAEQCPDCYPARIALP